jgi:peptidoglycan/LPS O-acetylase OafA/YrhL
MTTMTGVQRDSRAQRFPALDGMRALACYAVIATHVGFATGTSIGSGVAAPWLSRLDAAVPIFLVLSGFLLYRPFVVRALRGAPAPGALEFYWRRAVRLLPAFWLSVVVTLGLLNSQSSRLGSWLSYLTLTQIYDGHDTDPSLSHMWTLVVELSFYAAVPLFALSLRVRSGDAEVILRRQLLLLGCLVVVSFGWQLLTFRLSALSYETTKWMLGNVDWLALGMFLGVLSAMPAEVRALSRLRSVLADWAGSAGLCWLLALLMFWFCTLPVAGPIDLAIPTAWQHITKHVLEGGTALFLMLPLMLGSPSIISRLLGNPVSRFFGEISYGVYLWHLPMVIYLQRVLHLGIFQGHYLELFLLTAVSSTVLGALSWYLLERPLLRRFTRPSSLSSPAPPATAQQIAITHSV